MKQLALNIPLVTALSRLYYNIKTKSNEIHRAFVLLTVLAGKKDINIILADDDKEDVDIFLEAMSEIAPRAHVTVASNGRELSKLLLQRMDNLPDIIFLDLNMPLKNGLECLEEIRSNKKFEDVPVIIYSTSNSRDHINETFKGGASFYVPKPDSFSDLKVIVKKLFEVDWQKHMHPPKEKFVLSAAQIGKTL